MAKTTKKNEEKIEEVKVKTTKVKEETKVVEPVEETKAGKRLTRRKVKNDKLINLDRNRTVPVVSVSNFTIGYRTRETNEFITWNHYGEEHELKISEVINMMGKSDKYLKQPWLIVDDEEFVEAMNLGELYDLVFDLEDLDAFFKQPTRKIKEQLDKLSVSMRSDVLNRAISMIYNGEINNLQVVGFLKREYKIDVNI